MNNIGSIIKQKQKEQRIEEMGPFDRTPDDAEWISAKALVHNLPANYMQIINNYEEGGYEAKVRTVGSNTFTSLKKTFVTVQVIVEIKETQDGLVEQVRYYAFRNQPSSVFMREIIGKNSTL